MTRDKNLKKNFSPRIDHKKANFVVKNCSTNNLGSFKKSRIIDKLDAHYGFYLLKRCFSMPKLLYFLRTSSCFELTDFLECSDIILTNSLCKVTNRETDFSQFLQTEEGVLNVSSTRLLALTAVLASALRKCGWNQ